MSDLTRVLCALFGVIAITACNPINLAADSETDFRVIDLKIGVNPIGWKDDETIVLIGDSGERYARKDGAMEPVLRVMTLNYQTGRREVFGKVGGQFCYVDGYISYSFLDRATDELWVSYGELGNETVRKIKPGELDFDRGPTASCRPWGERPVTPPWFDEKARIWHLWPRLGLINCRSASVSIRTQHIKARFYKPDETVGIELPFSCYEVFRGLRYYPFKGAYFALEFDFRSPWPEGRDRRAFWLYPDGRVETIVLPYSTAIRESGIPTVHGIVAFARPVKREDDYWVYLVTPEATKHIMRGNASGVTSPDGCKVAMLHDPEFDARIDRRPVTTSVTLKVLELCKGK
jgi:hypothetical protein